MENFKCFKDIAIQTIQERKNRNIQNICKYWIEILDDYLWWIIENELVVIWAWAWIWKTELSIQIAIENAMRGKKVALFSLEWDIGEVVYRYFQKHMNLKLKKQWKWFIKWPEYRLNLKNVDKLEQEIFKEIPKEINNLYIFDKSFIPDKNKLLELFRDNYNEFDMFVIDHLHYLNFGENEYAGISEIVKWVKEMTEIIKKPVILISHLKRWYNLNWKLPTKSDLHWSSNIEKNANTIILLEPSDEPIEENNSEEIKYLRWTKIIVDKNRTWMPVPAIFETTFDLRTKEYLKWKKYNNLSTDEKNKITKYDKIF